MSEFTVAGIPAKIRPTSSGQANCFCHGVPAVVQNIEGTSRSGLNKAFQRIARTGEIRHEIFHRHLITPVKHSRADHHQTLTRSS